MLVAYINTFMLLIYLFFDLFISGGGANFIISTSFVGYSAGHGGVAPMCPHGYGCFYSVQADT